MHRIPVADPRQIPWRTWAIIALAPFVPVLLLVALGLAQALPGVGGAAAFVCVLAVPLALVVRIGASGVAVVRAAREARRTRRWSAVLLPLPALAASGLAVRVLGDTLRWMATR